MLRLVVVCFVAILVLNPASALEPGPNDVFIRVLDIGAGLACVIQLPGERYAIYDTGRWDAGGTPTFQGVQSIIPLGSTIGLLVQSHSDGDHVSATNEICENYVVERILHTGFPGTSGAWEDSMDAIREEVAGGALEINLSENLFLPGSTFRVGDAYLTMTFGLDRPRPHWISEDGLDASEARNSISIVMRLEYDGKSVLFCGDTIGRGRDDPQDAPAIAAEREMIENSHIVPLRSDVIIAPHHGGNNGSSAAFIAAVDPDYVILSAGHQHKHPREETVQRYLDQGVPLPNIFRTDLGDNEGGGEWPHGATAVVEPRGDDDIDILLRLGELEPVVAYRREG